MRMLTFPTRATSQLDNAACPITASGISTLVAISRRPREVLPGVTINRATSVAARSQIKTITTEGFIYLLPGRNLAGGYACGLRCQATTRLRRLAQART